MEDYAVLMTDHRDCASSMVLPWLVLLPSQVVSLQAALVHWSTRRTRQQGLIPVLSLLRLSWSASQVP